MKTLLFSLLIAFIFINTYADPIHFPAEKRLRNVKQLTFGGFNLQARFSQNGRYITFTGAGEPYESNCFQIYRLDLCKPGQPAFRLSVGFGEYATSSFYNDNQRLLLSTNFYNYLPLRNKTVHETCKSEPINLEEVSRRNHRDSFLRYDLFEVNAYGNIRRRLTTNNRYVESSLSPDSQWIAYTINERNSTSNLYLMKTDGTQTQKLTKTRGRKSSPSFSFDGTKVVFDAEQVDRFDKKSKRLSSGQSIEIFSLDLKENKLQQITNLDGENVSPFYHSNNKQVFFSSNFNKNSSIKFNIYVVDEDGNNLEKITFNDNGLDAFPTFTANGSKILFSSTRNSTNALNLFIADFVDSPDDEVLPDSLQCPQRKELSNRSKDQLKRPKSFKQLHFPDEKHLDNVRQLTFGGQNAEGYFSFDNKKVILQAAGQERYGTVCDQIYTLRVDEQVDAQTQIRRLSSGLGAHTCSYFFPGDKLSIHASTFASVTGEDITQTCPPKRCQTEQAKTDQVLKKLCNTSYVWDLHPDYDIYKVNEYGNILKRLTNSFGYDAEGAVSPDGKWIVFTSVRGGDVDLWLMDSNGENLRQLTNETGYDGGPFFSPDGTKISFRASRPKNEEELKKYKQLLSYNLVEPLEMELYTINFNGTGMRKITSLGQSNWAPFYLYDNRRIVFSTNFNATGHFGSFDLYLIGDDGKNLERVTYNTGGFDAFPMQSPNGQRFVWGSSRNGHGPMDLNLFLADWVD